MKPGETAEIRLNVGEPLENGAWAVRVHVKPFVRWIWLGALLMSLGGVCCVSDKRYRVKARTRVRDALGMAEQGA